ncbi:hypothetical protein LOK49_LG05G02486 [Camellia lanceoleosa]|uniref:Uncharacterized protein n=1 Tax=Camellia lanceoleosa TaxID=1840588 RepID=A0ACC0HMG4_9ERIC|nr:hypothetical protein LOK49_LG05G02486 [Camellia lanceoleosa]
MSEGGGNRSGEKAVPRGTVVPPRRGAVLKRITRDFSEALTLPQDDSSGDGGADHQQLLQLQPSHRPTVPPKRERERSGKGSEVNATMNEGGGNRSGEKGVRRGTVVPPSRGEVLKGIIRDFSEALTLPQDDSSGDGGADHQQLLQLQPGQRPTVPPKRGDVLRRILAGN